MQPLALIFCAVLILASVVVTVIFTKRIAGYFMTFTGNEACGYIGTALITGYISLNYFIDLFQVL